MTDIRERRYRVEAIMARLNIGGMLVTDEFLAALEADGLTITETETARAGETFRAYIEVKHPSQTIDAIEERLRVGEAVLRLEAVMAHGVTMEWHIHRRHGQVTVRVLDGLEQSKATRPTLPEAIEEALR